MTRTESHTSRVVHHLPRFDYLGGLFRENGARRRRIDHLRGRREFLRTGATTPSKFEIADGSESAAETARRFLATGMTRAILIGAPDDDVVAEILAAEIVRRGGKIRRTGDDRSCVRRVVELPVAPPGSTIPDVRLSDVAGPIGPASPPIVVSPSYFPGEIRHGSILAIDWMSDQKLVLDPPRLARLIADIVESSRGSSVRLLEDETPRPRPDPRDGAPWATRYGLDRPDRRAALIAIVEEAFPEFRDLLEIALGFAAMSCDPLEEMYAGNGLWERNADLLRNIA